MKEHIDLTRMWQNADRLYKEDMFLYLRVRSEEMPGSLLTPDPWFVCNERFPGTPFWAVTLNHEYLDRCVKEHRPAARAILGLIDKGWGVWEKKANGAWAMNMPKDEVARRMGEINPGDSISKGP